MIGLIAGSNYAFNALFLVLIVRAKELGASSGLIGLMLALAGAGAVCGALAAPAVQRRIEARVVIIGSLWLWTVGAFVLAFLDDPIALGAAFFGLIAVTGPAFNVVLASYRYALVPDALQGRVSSVVLLVAWGTIPLGSISAGYLIEWIGTVETMLVMAAVMLAVAVAGSLMPVVRGLPRPLARRSAARGDGVARARERRRRAPRPRRAVLVRRVADAAGEAADEDIALGTPAAARMPPSWPAPDGSSSGRPRAPRSRRGPRADRSLIATGSTRIFGPSRSRPRAVESRALRGARVDGEQTSSGSRWRHRLDLEPSDGRDRLGSRGRVPDREDEARRGDEGVLADVHRRRARVARPARGGDRAPHVADDRGDDPEGRPGAAEPRALLDMELEIRTGNEALGTRTGCRGNRPPRRERRRPRASAAAPLDGLEPGDDAERAVEPAAFGTQSRWEPVHTPGAARAAADEVAGASSSTPGRLP